MSQIWLVRCSDIILKSNKISLLTVDHFARDEHVLKTGNLHALEWMFGRVNIRLKQQMALVKHVFSHNVKYELDFFLVLR